MNLQQRSARKFNRSMPREKDSRLWWNAVLGLMVGVLLVAGFAFAANKHFAAHQASQRNVEMQREIERLKAERQRLLAGREAALAPQKLQKLAEKIGLQTPVAAQINVDAVALNQ